MQLHLGKVEAEDIWKEIVNKWWYLRTQLDTIDDGASDAAKDVGAAAMLMAKEIKQGYEQLRKLH